jgi:hypothetical protein
MFVASPIDLFTRLIAGGTRRRAVHLFFFIYVHLDGFLLGQQPSDTGCHDDLEAITI